MQDPPHQGEHDHHDHHDHKHHLHHDHEPHDAGREAEGEDRPHTPSYLRPPVAGRAQSNSGSEPCFPKSKSVEFDLPCPVSPPRPKSPWARYDPYDSNKVTQGHKPTEKFVFSSAVKAMFVCVDHFRLMTTV